MHQLPVAISQVIINNYMLGTKSANVFTHLINESYFTTVMLF